MSTPSQLGLYIHIPFCRSKCNYCDFNSFSGMEHLIPSYFDALRFELAHISQKIKSTGARFSSVFIGGGTPSFVDTGYIVGVLDAASELTGVSDDAEISIECNPGTLTPQKAKVYASAGINRVSIGLQACQQRLLETLGRIHSADDFIKAHQMATDAGIDNINADLIFGIPGQTMADWKDSVETIIRLGVKHVSCYSLKIEEGTRLGEWLAGGLIEVIDDELDRAMCHFAVDQLKSKGFRHYEISNFALPGFECKHNLLYWKALPYIGIGAGAHSYFNSKRYHNVNDPAAYVQKASDGAFPELDCEYIGRTASMREYMMLGLRLVDGIDDEEFTYRYGTSFFKEYEQRIASLVDKGLLARERRRLRLTGAGLDLANQVFMEFV